MISFFLCFRSELATEVVLHGTVRLDSKIRSQNVQFHESFWREQNLAATKSSLSFARIDFAAHVSSRAVRISSRAVRFFPAVLLRRVRPSYGTFSLKVFQGNCARGRTGHMIIILISKTKTDHFTRSVSISTGIGYKSSLWKPIDILCIKSFKNSTTQKYLKIPSNFSSKGLYRFKKIFNMGRAVNPYNALHVYVIANSKLRKLCNHRFQLKTRNFKAAPWSLLMTQ